MINESINPFAETDSARDKLELLEDEVLCLKRQVRLLMETVHALMQDMNERNTYDEKLQRNIIDDSRS